MNLIWFHTATHRGDATDPLDIHHWYDGVNVGNLDNSANWQEMSGLATPRLAANEPYMWVLSDAPANMLACINKSTAANAGVWTLTGMTAGVDWEDLETQTVNGTNYMYVMDFGNNGNAANSRGSGIDMRILRVVEPTITGSNGSTTNFIEINCAFPAVNGPTLRDCEATIVDENGKIWIITKRDAIQKVYSLDHAATYTGTQTLVYEGIMTALPESRTAPLTTTPCYAVDAALSPNGKEILVKNYSNVYFFPRDPATQTIIQALQQPLVDVPAYCGGGFITPKKSHPNAEPQGEGIAFDYDGLAWFSTSEYLTAEGSSATTYPLKRYDRAPDVPTVAAFQNGVLPDASYTGNVTTYIWGTNPTTDRSGEATYVVDFTSGNPTDDRRGLIKFDLSSIPSTATIIGAKLEQRIEAEGQGWKAYKMLVPWVASSTHTSLGGVNNDGVKARVAESWRNGVNLDTIVNVKYTDNVLVSDVQEMVANPATNYGWLLKGLDESAGGDGVQFAGMSSATATNKPKLTVYYVL